MKTQVNLKIDPEVKLMAQKRARDIGLSLSSVVNASLKQFANTGELQLSSNYKMTPQLEKTLAKARTEYEKGKSFGPFNTVKEMFKSLED
ncbi:MAG: type II toxin-antitoxin system RelB/DinJ family antitoxin [Candidatus Pacebacteria bacterium]|nr:type II toxin-antitoxin system RelB/DinJ family antitoxin [Candidatus Paceibacterota bacterium]